MGHGREALPLVLLLWVAGCGPPQHLETPDAEVFDEELDFAMEQLPPSYVSAPVVFDLRPLLQELEVTVPRRIGSIEKNRRLQVNGKTWVAPELTRGPFRFTFAENRVRVSTTFEYRAKAWFKPLLIEQSVSCGMGDVKPRLHVAIETSYDLTPDWRLQTRSRVVDVTPVSREERDQCEITFLHLDVTGKVADAAESALRTALGRLDRRLHRVSLREPIEGLWDKLQQPISIAEGTVWLRLQPRAISVGQVTAQDSTLVARLDLLASPRLVSGGRPPDDTLPLPPLGRTLAVTDTAVVLLEGTLLYPMANQLLAEALRGKSLGSGWKRVRVEDVSMSHAGRGRVTLAVRVSGRADGVVHVTGTPTYDAATDLITVPDLAFDVHSRSYLTSAAAWLVSGPYLDDIRRKVAFPASRLLADAAVLANREVNRELSDGVHLRGVLDTARTMEVRATHRGLVARARGTGRLWLEISRTDLLPELPRTR